MKNITKVDLKPQINEKRTKSAYKTFIKTVASPPMNKEGNGHVSVLSFDNSK